MRRGQDPEFDGRRVITLDWAWCGGRSIAMVCAWGCANAQIHNCTTSEVAAALRPKVISQAPRLKWPSGRPDRPQLGDGSRGQCFALRPARYAASARKQRTSAGPALQRRLPGASEYPTRLE